MAVDNEGNIVAVGSRQDIQSRFSRCRRVDCGAFVIAPGLVDCHQHLAHFHWVRLVPDLFGWLEEIYKLEQAFADTAFAARTAKSFFSEVARNGTTTCCVHGPYFAEATDAAFERALESGLRVLMGMNAGDTNLPDSLWKPASASTPEALDLCRKWNGAGDGLLSYCFTVRPGYCASAELLAATAEAAAHEKARLQCHLGEDAEGQAEILRCFPSQTTETGVYDSFGLLGERTIMAHGIHVTDQDYEILRDRGVAVAHCPRSNLLAGGRQLDLKRVQSQGIRVGLGTDLGAGKGLSVFRTMEDALKVTPSLSVHDLFRLATTDGARALGLDERVGTLEPGMEADFVVFAPKIEGSSVMARAIEDILSRLVFRGDDRDVRAVYVRGKQVHTAGSS
jgi:guanine deaminase